MLVGPLFYRELTTAPRRPRTYLIRGAYGAGLLLLMFTAYLVLTGTQVLRDVGDLARFGASLFQMLAPLQMVLVLFFSALLAASSVSQEKERRTLVLLLLTRLTNSELVLGKLLASLLSVAQMIAVSAPIMMLVTLLGGVSYAQVGRVLAVTAAAALACGSLGSTLALWREKTFQALAATVLAIVIWIVAGELVASGLLGEWWLGLSAVGWAASFSPWQAVLWAVRPLADVGPAAAVPVSPVYLFLLFAMGLTALLNAIAVLRVRHWHTVRDEAAGRRGMAEAEEDAAAQAAHAGDSAAAISADTSRPSRHVWDNPVLWREIRTWAYGRRILIVHLAYLMLFAAAAWAMWWMRGEGVLATTFLYALIPTLLLSLVLVNAQAVTAITSERDAKALDILLVTRLTPKEIVFGKLGGIFYNSKQMWLLPLLMCGWLVWARVVSLEAGIYLIFGLLVLFAFVATLGIHAGMVYDNTRQAIATSLGTVFFLTLGVATCMRIMTAFSGMFHVQLLPFTVLFVGGGVGLYLALGARNPSAAIGVASFLCPFAMFYGIISAMQGATLPVFLVTAVAYGFATAAMLVPAISEFDVAVGRGPAEDS